MFTKKPFILLICFFLLMALFQQGSVAYAKGSVVVTADNLNIREGPGLQYKIIMKAQKGKSYQIEKEQDDWIHIVLDSGTKGWINKNYAQKEDLKAQQDKVGIVTASILNLRSQPSSNSKSIGKLKKGTKVTIHSERNEWLKVSFQNQQGWIAGWYIEKETGAVPATANETIEAGTVTIQHNGTNIRSGSNLSAKVVERANSGDQYPIVGIQQDWYEIKLSNGKKGFVAGWIVSVSHGVRQLEKAGSSGSKLKYKKIMIDPGHGGNDNGATGIKGTLEKDLTIKTGQAVYEKLKAKGVHAILTRNHDQYVSLSTRVSMARYKDVDAFISLHYDSINNRTVRGMTSYYYHSNQKELATAIHKSTVASTGLKDRGVRFGDYHVIRENKHNSVLLELGYISNPTEELLLNTVKFQELVANGIVQGLENYFN